MKSPRAAAKKRNGNVGVEFSSPEMQSVLPCSVSCGEEGLALLSGGRVSLAFCSLTFRPFEMCLGTLVYDCQAGALAWEDFSTF